MTKSLFGLHKNIFFEDLQEIFSEIKCNSTTENNFEADFWEKYFAF